jgi:hypothetical protein
MENHMNNINNEFVSLKKRLDEIKKVNKLKKDLLDYFYNLLQKNKRV